MAAAGKPASTTVPLLTLWQKLVLAGIFAVVLSAWMQLHSWLAQVILLHGFTSWPFAVLSTLFYCCLCLATFDSLSSLVFHFRARKVDESLKAPRFRVAMIATKVPSEPLSMLRETLSAILAQDYPHPYDVWLADEDPDAATKAWCSENGVRISCRKGVEAYHQPQWPRRTRCKEGNLAYFYDNWGYQQYNVVAQFDADHVPAPTYLSTVLPAFRDEAVGYVALPSICGANEKEHGWVVRMRLFAESVMHGSQGASRSCGWLPCAIGSHYVVRTQHLRAVGGIGPELDEDMSTSVILSAAGYKGVFSITTIANGDGPATFEDSMLQEYQWARSAVLLYAQHLGPCFRQGNWRIKFRMSHIVANWLVGFAVQAGMPLLLTVVAFASAGSAPTSTDAALGSSPDSDAPLVYLVPTLASPCQPGVLYGLQLLAGGLMFSCFLSANGWLRPVDTPVLSWEAMLHLFCAPFFGTKGTLHGLYSHFTGQQLSIKVTPKGPQGERLLPPSAIMPFAASAVLLSAAGLANPGMVLLLAPGAMAHCFVAALLVCLHYRDHHSLRRLPVHNLLALLAPIATAAGCTVALLRARGHILAAFASEVAVCATRGGVGGPLRHRYPGTLSYTVALVAAALLVLTCFSRRVFSTPLRTHRRCPSSSKL